MGKAALVVSSVFGLLAVALLAVGTAADVYRLHGESMVGNGPCLTVWGSKEKCYSTTYSLSPNKLFPDCSTRVTLFKVSQGLGIGSAGLAFIGVLFCYIALCNWRVFKILDGIATTVAFIASCGFWGLAISQYYSNYGDAADCRSFRTDFHFGGGFVLFVAGSGFLLFSLALLTID